MSVHPKGNLEKLERVLGAWKTLKPEKTYSGISLADFEAYVAACQVARQAVQAAENRLRDALTERDAKDFQALAKVQAIKIGVLADPTDGVNSSIYEAMGYIRQEDRKTGLTRKKKVA
jgi:hypothetical protein